MSKGLSSSAMVRQPESAAAAQHTEARNRQQHAAKSLAGDGYVSISLRDGLPETREAGFGGDEGFFFFAEGEANLG